MMEWWEAMGENLQCSEKGCEIEEAGNTLESVCEIDCEDEAFDLSSVSITFIPLPDEMVSSRRDRLDQAIARLETVENWIISELEQIEAEDAPMDDDKKEFLERIADEIDEVRSEVEDVSFPSMY